MNREDLDRLMESTFRPLSGKLVQGIGINDAPHAVALKTHQGLITHRAYEDWHSIIARCYSPKALAKRPSYHDCLISDEWVFFSKFKSWWVKNHVAGWQIDKDLLVAGNKVYGPSTCLFIPQHINNFTISCNSRRGDYPVGVSMDSRTGRFRARVQSGKKKTISIGMFPDPISAHKAWYKKKVEIAYGYKDECDAIHEKLFDGVMAKIDSMRAEIYKQKSCNVSAG